MSLVVEVTHPRDAQPATLERSLELLRSRRRDSPGFADRVAALDALSKAIIAPSSTLKDKLPREGLAYLATFLSGDFLEGIVGRELKDAGSLDAFVPVGPRKSIRLVPRGLVCHWVAGNVPLLALFSWAVATVVGNRNLIRLSSRQGDPLTPLLEGFASVSAIGARLAAETHVVSFDRDNAAAHEAMSRAADVRIAWGGRDAVEAIRDLPTGWQCEDVVFGPRASMAVVDPAMMDAAGIRRLATDVALFDQLACSSPQQIFVKGDRDSEAFGAFVAEFSGAFESQSRTFPRHPLSFSETYRISLDRARVLLDGGVAYRDEGTAWTVAVVATPSNELNCANRFVQVIPFARIDDVFPHIPSNVQTIVTRLTNDEWATFTEAAAELGVCRFPVPGEGNNFENPWDGVGLVSRLTRAVIRTDPAD